MTSAALAVLGAGAAAEERDPVKVVEKLNPKGIVWANPYHGRKLRVLFLCFDKSVGEAGCVARRLEMDYKVVGALSQSWVKPGPERVQRTLRALEGDYDVIVLGGGLCFTSFPLEVQYELFRKSIAGVGVVTFGWRNSFPKNIIDPRNGKKGGDALQGIPFGAFESLRPDKEGKHPADRLDEFGRFVPGGIVRLNQGRAFDTGLVANEVEKLRLIKLPFCGSGHSAPISLVSKPLGHGMYSPDMYIYDEYYLSALCKAILWAARRGPAVKVLNVLPRGDVLAPGRFTSTARSRPPG